MQLIDINIENYSLDIDTCLIYSHNVNRLLVTRPNSSGYARTSVWIKGVRKHIFNHIKVVEFYGDVNGIRIPPFATSLRELKLSIDHLDEDKMNPIYTNLELVTHSENCKRRDSKPHYEQPDTGALSALPDL